MKRTHRSAFSNPSTNQQRDLPFMRHTVLGRLQLLMQVPGLPTLEKGKVFGEDGCYNLPDEAYDLLDQIHDSARNVFGGGAPSPAQTRELETAGFAVMWRSGTIRTPKGLVRYKP